MSMLTTSMSTVAFGAVVPVTVVVAGDQRAVWSGAVIVSVDALLRCG